MKQWFRRARAALGMGVIWALAWAVIGGGIMEGIVDRDGRILDMWPQTLAIPGFLSGVLFSVLLLVGDRRRRFDELSHSRVATWGIGAGIALGSVALALGAGPGITPVWLRLLTIYGPLTVLTTASATGSLALARKAQDKHRLSYSDDVRGLPEET